MNWFYKKFKTISRFFLVATFLFVIIASITASLIYSRSSKNIINDKKVEISDILNKELESLFENSKELAGDKNLYQYFYNEDVVSLLDILNTERQARNIDTMLVTNTDGEVITRAPSTIQKGDNVFIITSFGRFIVEKGSLSSFVAGQNRPIMMASGHIIREGDDVVGALFVAQEFDDDYARYLKNELGGNYDIFIFSKDAGLVGESIQDKEISNITKLDYAKVFNYKIENEPFLIKTQGHKLLSNKLILLDQDGLEIGSLLIVDNDAPQYLVAEVVYILLVVVLLFVYLFYLKKKKRLSTKKQIIIVYSILFFIILVSLDFFIKAISYERMEVVEIKNKEQIIYNSVIKIKPTFDIIKKNSVNTAAVSVDSGGETINAIDAVIQYDPGSIKVKDIIMTRSICGEAFVIKKEIDNKLGKLEVSCVIPNPGAMGRDIILTDVVFEAIKESRVNFEFSPETRVLANDGLATDVLRETYNAHYDIIDFSKPNSLHIYSYSNPDSEQFYKNNIVELAWICNGDFCNDYIYSLSKNPTDMPIFQGNTLKKNSVSLNLFEDGVWYFHLASVDNEGQIILSDHFKISFDNTGPNYLEIKKSSAVVRSGEVVRFEFKANDELSGIKHNLFYVKLGNGIFLPSRSELNVAFSDLGRNTMTVRAFDRAGNIKDSVVNINVVE